MFDKQSLTKESDWQLAQRVAGYASGDVSLMEIASHAYGILFERHHERLYRTLFNAVSTIHWSKGWLYPPTKEDVEDLVQDTFIRFRDYAKDFKKDRDFIAYLCQVGKNLYRDALKRKLTEMRQAVDEDPEHYVHVRKKDDKHPDEQDNEFELVTSDEAIPDRADEEDVPNRKYEYNAMLFEDFMDGEGLTNLEKEFLYDYIRFYDKAKKRTRISKERLDFYRANGLKINSALKMAHRFIEKFTIYGSMVVKRKN